MRILITNDDGIYSPGITALARIAARLGDVRVFAPDIEQSASAHAITHSKPLRAKRVRTIPDTEAFRVNGTPADCVALGTYLWEHVDVVLSGINLGPNLGNGMWHSGTLAGAKQAQLLGIPGIALSTPLVGEEEPDFEALAPQVDRVLRLLLSEYRLPLVNVNFPPERDGRETAIRWTRQAVEAYDGKVVPIRDPMGRQHYWLTVVPLDSEVEGTDLWALDHGFISITPLRLDLTDHAELERLRREHPFEAGAPEPTPSTPVMEPAPVAKR